MPLYKTMLKPCKYSFCPFLKKFLVSISMSLCISLGHVPSTMGCVGTSGVRASPILQKRTKHSRALKKSNSKAVSPLTEAPYPSPDKDLVRPPQPPSPFFPLQRTAHTDTSFPLLQVLWSLFHTLPITVYNYPEKFPQSD